MTDFAVPSGQAPRKSFREVWLITIGHALTHWYPATFYLLLPLIGSELGLSYVQIGSILTTQALCGAICNIPGGLLVDSVSRKGLLMATSLFWVGAPYLLMGFPTTTGCCSPVRRWSGSATTSGIRPQFRCLLSTSRIARAWPYRSTAWAPTWAMRWRRSWPVCCLAT